MKDYYNILGLDSSASEDQIRQAYKRLAMQHHPDRGGDAARFQEIQEAYSTLTDSNKRAQWEQQRSFEQHGPGNFSFSFNFGPDLNEIFGNRFQGHPFGNSFRQQPRNRDLRIVIELDLASTLQPQVKHVDIKDPHGSSRTVQVDIPRGVQGNMQMRYPGHGENHIKTVPPGDLYVEFRILNHSNFEVNGLNLHTKASINCIDAMLGTKILIKTLDDLDIEMSVPRGTQPGTQFRLASQGLWDINHPIRGDLFVEILLEVPRTLTIEQLDKLKELV